MGIRRLEANLFRYSQRDHGSCGPQRRVFHFPIPMAATLHLRKRVGPDVLAEFARFQGAGGFHGKRLGAGERPCHNLHACEVGSPIIGSASTVEWVYSRASFFEDTKLVGHAIQVDAKVLPHEGPELSFGHGAGNHSGRRGVGGVGAGGAGLAGLAGGLGAFGALGGPPAAPADTAGFAATGLPQACLWAAFPWQRQSWAPPGLAAALDDLRGLALGVDCFLEGSHLLLLGSLRSRSASGCLCRGPALPILCQGRYLSLSRFAGHGRCRLLPGVT